MSLPAGFAKTRLLAMDVDGVLTDGSLVYTDAGESVNRPLVQKRFHVSDGLGIALLRMMGIKIAWITGRADSAVELRAAELKIDALLVGVVDKGVALKGLSDRLDIPSVEIAYIGDDWNDLPAFYAAGTRIAVQNAAIEVKSASHFVTLRCGGNGAVREVCDLLLAERGETTHILSQYLAMLTEPTDNPVSILSAFENHPQPPPS